MVLEGASDSSPTSDPFMQDGPSSDIDPYAADSTAIPAQVGDNERIYHIDAKKLPYVLGPFPAPISGRAVHALADHLQTVQQILNRPLSQQEVDGLSYHFVNGMRITSFGIPIGFAAGILGGYRTQGEEWKFPFWKPKEGGWFNPERFGPLRGDIARRAWSFARYNAWGFTGLLLGSIFFGTYSVSVSSAGRAQDPRLKDFNKELSERIRRSRNEPMPPRQGQRSPITTQAGGMDNQVERARAMLERSRQRQPQTRQTDEDDMSPTSGSWMDDYKQSPSDTGLLSDDQIRAQERSQRPSEYDSPTSNRDMAFDMDKVTSQPSNNHASSPQTGAQPSKQLPAGNSWERIRREAAAAKQGTSQEQRQGRTAGWGSVQREQQQGSTVGDSFSFSNQDEDRELAKTEAQKDFDARVERERQGGDFTEGSRSRKW